MSYNKLSKIFDELFPILRSITGPGYRKSLEILKKYINFKILKYISGKKVFDWTVPYEWHFYDGYIRNLNNRKIVDVKKNNLHILNYSSSIDKKILGEYMSDYSYELKNTSYFQLRETETTYHPFRSWSKLKIGMKDLFSYSEMQENHHLMVYEKEDNLIWFDIGGMARYEKRSSNVRLPYMYHYSLAVLLGDQVAVYSDADLYSLIYNSDADLYSLIYNNEFSEYPHEYKGGFPQYHEGFYGFEYEMSFEYAHAYIQHSSNIGDIAIKVEPISWGNGRTPIILSDNVPPFAMLSWTKQLGTSRFSFFHGSILPAVSDTAISGLIINAPKYLVGHRWEIAVTNKLKGAFTEMLVYGGRDPDFLPPNDPGRGSAFPAPSQSLDSSGWPLPSENPRMPCPS